MDNKLSDSERAAYIMACGERDKRIAELEERLNLVREQRDNELRTNSELENRLATPVRLPERYYVDCGVGPDPNGDWLYYSEVANTLREQGFTVEGDA